MATTERIIDTSGITKASSQSPAIPIELDKINLSSLSTLNREQLLDLVARMACQCGLVASMTDEQTAQAMLDTLAETALKPVVMGIGLKADIQSRMNAIDKWMDRKKGRPAQSMEVTRKIDILDLIEEAGRQEKKSNLLIDNHAKITDVLG